MRWKLIILASLVAAIIGFGLWCALAIGFFGTARNLARYDWILLASFLLPLGMAMFAGFFVYRHTARRRKLQALLASALAIVLAALTYFVGTMVAYERLEIPRTYEVRHAR